MYTTRARLSALMSIAGVALGATRIEGQGMDENATNSTAMSPTQSKSNWSLCGAGTFELSAAGQSVGSETFEITCAPDRRYTASGHTQLKVGVAIDLTTTLELGADMLPISAASKGSVQGQPFDQSGKFANGVATLTTNGAAQSIPYTKDASWMGGNIFFPHVFILARYDESKGGAQQVPVFPSLTVSIEQLAGTGIAAADGQSANFAHFVMRIATQELHFWRDASGKLAVITIPAQKVVAARPESAKWATMLLDYKASSKPATPSTSPSADKIDYSAPANASFSAEEVTIPVGGYSLAGTLLEPKSGKKPFPAVVMITGSGLQTRDSRIALPGLEGYVAFRQIAERLAANGVAVLRVDDRGIGGSTGRETLQSATTTSLAEDTRAQIAWLRKRSEVDGKRIIVIGHSEGASIATMVASTDPTIYAVAMMAGVAKRGADVSFEQQEDMLRSDTTMTEATRQAMREKQKEAVKTILEGGEVPGTPINAWTREYMAYDPLPAVRKVKQPLLILQGERDRQVYQEHATMLANAARSAGNSKVTVKVFPTLNHLFLPSKTGSFSEYSHLETTAVPSDVLDTIAMWIASLK
jgi:dienelactone hydrolase